MNCLCFELKEALKEEHPELANRIKPPRQLSACEYNPESQAEILAGHYDDSDVCLYGDLNEPGLGICICLMFIVCLAVVCVDMFTYLCILLFVLLRVKCLTFDIFD